MEEERERQNLDILKRIRNEFHKEKHRRFEGEEGEEGKEEGKEEEGKKGEDEKEGKKKKLQLSKIKLPARVHSCPGSLPPPTLML